MGVPTLRAFFGDRSLRRRSQSATKTLVPAAIGKIDLDQIEVISAAVSVMSRKVFRWVSGCRACAA
jgi:hypothetical protein